MFHWVVPFLVIFGCQKAAPLVLRHLATPSFFLFTASGMEKYLKFRIPWCVVARKPSASV